MVSSSLYSGDGAVEEMLTDLWTEVLKVEPIGVHHNFFELGGHSLLAIQIVSRLSQEYDIELPLRQLFEYPIIAELAPAIEAILMAEAEA